MGTFIYGWLSGTGQQLFVYQTPHTWGVSYDISKATPFESIEACKVHYMSKHCQQERYEKFTRDGTVKYFNLESKQLYLF